VLKSLPESIDFLVYKRPAKALKNLNRVLERMGRSPLAELPEPSSTARSSQPWVVILSWPNLRRTLALCLGWLLVMFSVYFVLSWTPKLIVAAGLTAQDGLHAGILLNVGGIFGGALFGLFALKCGTRSLLCIYFIATALLFGYLGRQLSSVGVGPALAVVAGAGAFGCMTGMYALTPTVYSPEYRSTAMGLTIGFGRIGAVIAPIAAGALLDNAWPVSMIYGAFAIPLVIAVFSVAAVKKANAEFTIPTVATVEAD
jgi:MFS family permease